jgi:hypothetical protein
VRIFGESFCCGPANLGSPESWRVERNEKGKVEWCNVQKAGMPDFSWYNVPKWENISINH